MSRPAGTPDLDAEQEVDLGGMWRTIASRRWLPAGGLVLGGLVGAILSLGGGQVYKADATVFLGQPFSPNGNAPVQSLATNPRTVGTIVHSEYALKRAAAVAGLHVGALRGKVSTSTVAAPAGQTKVGGSQLVVISVQGRKPRKTEDAANELARIVVGAPGVSGYVRTKIAAFNVQLASEQKQLNSLVPRVNALNAALRSRGLAPLDQLALISQLDNAEARRGQLLDLQSTTQQQLSLAEDVESAQVVTPAVAVKSTARSRRNSILVGALIGLILGSLAALAWDSLATRARTA